MNNENQSWMSWLKHLREEKHEVVYVDMVYSANGGNEIPKDINYILPV